MQGGGESGAVALVWALPGQEGGGEVVTREGQGDRPSPVEGGSEIFGLPLE